METTRRLNTTTLDLIGAISIVMAQGGYGTTQILTAIILIMALSSAGIMLYTASITANKSKQKNMPTTTIIIEACKIEDNTITLYVRNLSDQTAYITQALIDKPYGEQPIPIRILTATPVIIKPKQVKPIPIQIPTGLQGIYIITIVESGGAQATQPIEL